RALSLKPDCLDALLVRCTALFDLMRFEEAALDCERALALNPELDYMRGFLVHFRMQCCDWRDLRENERAIAEGLRNGKRIVQPFKYMMLHGTPAQQLQCARIWARSEVAAPSRRLWNGERYAHTRIRLAFLSEDFRVHPVAQLLAGVFE